MGKNKTSKGMTKSAIYQELADKSGATRKQVSAVFDSLNSLIKRNLKKDGDIFLADRAGNYRHRACRPAPALAW